ncbi:amino acid-binding protein [Paenarthrobacter nitroguajacolicus]|uniref:Amino acid-binding protein n=1 Tax=Paenarthrobacter nitroguajacolicus TaxID=211146 RepID=A0A558H628_PAENT|nr:amino acid-binding protein [Paenarthrobacter nitroguajacolicus]TVU64584.1 amino acid-binding protein [Paenarthrobacter nitroguajacolicus]
MKPNPSTPLTADLLCDVCGQLPEPPKARLTLANIAVMLPIELLVHAAVVETHLPYVAKVLLLAVTATVLVIWVAEPSAAKVLRRWLHASALRQRRQLHLAPSLWRARTLLHDQPGSLQKITHSLAKLDTNILSLHVHLMAGTGMDNVVMDEFVLSAPGNVTEQELLKALDDGGGRESHVWPTTALAMADGQTKALSLATRVAGNPQELPMAVAELLSAKVVPIDPEHPKGEVTAGVGPSTDILKIPTAWHGPLVFSRQGEPFTPAESARAHRLAELAEILAHRPAEPRRSSPVGAAKRT